MEIFTPLNFAYWILLAIVILVQTLTIGRLWLRREAARWTLGYISVFIVGLLPLLAGEWHFGTYAALFVGVGISGAVKVGVQQYTEAHHAAQLRRHYAERLDLAEAEMERQLKEQGVLNGSHQRQR